MPDSFLKGMSGGAGKKIADDWMAHFFGPALLFWGGGILLVEFSSWWRPSVYFFEINANRQIVLGIVFVLVVILSDIVMEWFTLPLLRLLEGYYWPAPIRIWMIRKLQDELDKAEEELQNLPDLSENGPEKGSESGPESGSENSSENDSENDSEKGSESGSESGPEKGSESGPEKGSESGPENDSENGSESGSANLSLEEHLTIIQKHVQLDEKLKKYPSKLNYLMPTTIGNRLRAAEMHSNDRYGLEAVTVWPHLWLVLPEETKQELITARQQLDKATQLFGWGILFLSWIYYSWCAPLFWVLSVMIAYWRINHSAGIYGDLIKAAFDLHRFELYKQMNWPLPENSEEEKEEGKRLTEYIYRGPQFFKPRQDFKHLST